LLSYEHGVVRGLQQRRKLRLGAGGFLVAQQGHGQTIACRNFIAELLLAQVAVELRERIARGPLIGAQLGAHQLEIEAVGRLPVREPLNPVLRVGDALGGDRVAAQIGWRIVFIQAPRPLHAHEKRRHRAHIEARFLQGQETETIGLALEFPRKADLRGNCARLPDGGGSRSELGIAGNDGQRHSRQHRR
jgi:hypothetical protein